MKKILLFLVILTSGCATYPDRDEYESRLRSSSTLVKSLEQIEYTALTFDEIFKFELGGDGNVFNFGNGFSFYKGFSLPNIKSKVSVEVISLFNSYAQAMGHVPYVTILILNENYEEVLRKESSMNQGREPGGSTHFKDTILINEEARFIVVYVDPSNIDKLVPWYYGAYHMGAVGELFSGDKGAKVGFGGPMKVRIKL